LIKKTPDINFNFNINPLNMKDSNTIALMWMKEHEVNSKIIEYVRSLLRYNKKLGVNSYKIHHLIEDLEKGVIQGGASIGVKKIEDLFNKLKDDNLIEGYKLTSKGLFKRKRKKLFGIF